MTETPKTPWHYWAVTVFALAWMTMGATDYVMTQGGNEAYLSNFTEAERALFTGFPTWVIATWALSIWSAVLAARLMLFRSRFVVPLYAISALFFVITCIHNYILSDPPMHQVVGAFAVGFSVVIAAVIAFLYWYAARAKAKHILR